MTYFDGENLFHPKDIDYERVKERRLGWHRVAADVIDMGGIEIHNRICALMDQIPDRGDRHKNIAALFYQEILYVISAYHIRHVERRLDLISQEMTEGRLKSIPYIDFSDLAHGINPDRYDYPDLEKDIFNLYARDRRARFVSALSQVTGAFGPTIGLTKSWLKFRDLFPTLIKRGCKVTLPTLHRIPILNFSEQWAVLAEGLGPLIAEIAPERDRAALLEVVRRHISAYVTDTPARLGLDVLMSGSVTTLSNRLIAAQARSEGASVLMVRHGYGDGMHDHPASGASEASYATHLLSYGRANAEQFAGTQYLTSVTDDPEWLGSNAELIQDIYDPGAPIKPLAELDDPGLVYVTNSATSFRNYAPYRALSDVTYRHWQYRLLEMLPKSKVKPHPFEARDLFQPYLQDGRVMTGRLEDVLDGIDAFVFDYISSALFLACATDKPVIFLNLSITNPTETALKLLRQRCLFVDVLDKTDDQLRTEIQAQLRDVKSNSFVPFYCLADHSETRAETALNTVARILRHRRGRRAT